LCIHLAQEVSSKQVMLPRIVSIVFAHVALSVLVFSIRSKGHIAEHHQLGNDNSSSVIVIRTKIYLLAQFLRHQWTRRRLVINRL